jgi:hypothetical protein
MKKAVISWGRFNPPTVGHEKLVQKVMDVARRERGEPRVYLTHTQNASKDPLSYKDKIMLATRAFGSVVKVSASRTIIQLMVELQKAGFKEVVVVAGSDRVSEYTALLNKYNGKDYTFDKVKVVSAGERDPDAEGVEGMSASKMRKAVADGDIDAFMKGVPSRMSKTLATKMYNMLRKGMLIEEIQTFLEKNKDKIDIDDSDFSDAELEKAVKELEEEDDLDEEYIEERAPLTLQQRLKRGRTMKRLAPRLKRLRQIKKFRMAPKETLEKRAKKVARNLMRKKFAGKKGENYTALSASEKITVDKLIATKSSVIERLAKRLMPKIRKNEIERIRQARQSKNENIEYIIQSVDRLFEKTVTPQDDDIEDRKGTQPARYHAGLAKGTKIARDAQFKKQSKMASDNPAAYKPAPGDATAETKPSKYTKSYKQMFGEAKTIKVGEDAVGSDTTHYGLIKNREVVATGSKDDMLAASEEMGGRVWVTTKNVGEIVEGEATAAAKERIRREKEQDKAKHDRALDRARLLDTRTKNRQTEETELTEKSLEALQTKAKKSGYSYGTLKKVYDRGVAAWRTGHRPGTTPQQWGYARVNAFIAKQKSGQKLNHDTDLTNSYVVESLDESLQIEKGAGIGTLLTASDIGMKLQGAFQYHPSVQEEGGAGEKGTKKLTDKYKKDTPGEIDEATLIDNFCECNDLYENLVITEAEYQGKTVKLNDPIRSSEVPTKKFKVYVKDPSTGNIKVVRFGDPNLSIKRDDPERRKSFRARHKCDNPGPITKARYWSCFQWRAGSKVDN